MGSFQIVLPEEKIVADVVKPGRTFENPDSDSEDIEIDFIEKTNLRTEGDMYPPLDPNTKISIPRPVLLSER